MAAMGHLMLAPLVSTQYQSFSWWSSAMPYKCSSVQPPLRKTTNAFPRLPKCPKFHVWPTFRKHVNPLDLTQVALSPNLPDIRGRNDLQSPRQLLKDMVVFLPDNHPTQQCWNMLKHVETRGTMYLPLSPWPNWCSGIVLVERRWSDQNKFTLNLGNAFKAKHVFHIFRGDGRLRPWKPTLWKQYKNRLFLLETKMFYLQTYSN